MKIKKGYSELEITRNGDEIYICISESYDGMFIQLTIEEAQEMGIDVSKFE